VDKAWKLKADLTAEELSSLPSSSCGKQVADVSLPSSSHVQRLDELEFSVDSLRHDMIDMWSSFQSQQNETHELLAMVNQKVNQMFYLSALSFTATGSIMPISEDAEKFARERAGNVLLNCERVVRDRPLVRPTHTEPTILTIEEYEVVKRYRDRETQRKLDEMLKDRVFADAHERWKNRCEEEVKYKRYHGACWYNR